MYRAEVERHSVGPDGQELLTFVIEFPRVVLAETVTHRMNSDTWDDSFAVCERTTTKDVSKNSASSRAIPHARMIDKIVRDPYVPSWTGAKAGMQGDPLAADLVPEADRLWLKARELMRGVAGELDAIGVHKQDSNRLLENWAWVTQVVTATRRGWSNFFALRCHGAAAPAFRTVARMMYLGQLDSVPDRLDPDQWHLPFVPKDEALAIRWRPSRLYPLRSWEEMPPAVRQSVARCAWTSYENHDKDASQGAVDRTCLRLVGSSPVHASPCEHQGSPEWEGVLDDHGLASNLDGWLQLRKLLPQERVEAYNPPRAEVEGWPEYKAYAAKRAADG